MLALPLHSFRSLDISLLAGHIVLDIMNYSGELLAGDLDRAELAA